MTCATLVNTHTHRQIATRWEGINAISQTYLTPFTLLTFF